MFPTLRKLKNDEFLKLEVAKGTKFFLLMPRGRYLLISASRNGRESAVKIAIDGSTYPG